MNHPEVALALGLLLLGIAGWLLLRINGGFSSKGRDAHHEIDHDSVRGRNSDASGITEEGRQQDNTADNTQDDLAQDDLAENTQHNAEEKGLTHSGKRGRDVAERQPRTFGGGSRRGLWRKARAARRQWAANHGYEYHKQDPTLTQHLGVPAQGTATHVISGYFHGQQMHCADIDGHTIVALHRQAASPVIVRFTQGAPQGAHESAHSAEQNTLPGAQQRMQRAAGQDHPPFQAYTNNPHALQRMIDERTMSSLDALATQAHTITWQGEWLLVDLSTADPQHWEAALPHVHTLAQVGLLLPPEQLNTVLEMEHADQTRPLPGAQTSIHVRETPGQHKKEEHDAGEGKAAAAGVATGAATPRDITPGDDIGGSSAGQNAAEDTAEARAGSHIRAVPDVRLAGRTRNRAGESVDPHAGLASDAQSEGEPGLPAPQAAPMVEGEQEPQVALGFLEAQDSRSEHPDITRPAEPVTFPSRSLGRLEGNSADFSEFHVGSVDLQKVQSADHGALPRLGEDPGHIRPSTARYAQVIRAHNGQATIFGTGHDTPHEGMPPEGIQPQHVQGAPGEGTGNEHNGNEHNGQEPYGQEPYGAPGEGTSAQEPEGSVHENTPLWGSLARKELSQSPSEDVRQHNNQSKG